ncbi:MULTISPECIES: hypothetical protein [Streptococcus]|jgi:hypothetical protein|uniref:hypothetical protein n=1 Tax=Streptococcus TaxID=1301 RepID=UPI00066DDA36|nr:MULTISPECIES: hypothetical protein [Streptococcus]DAR91778.1 MAG TPA: hypothetical protein [Caudoviricetes sp.]DAU76640.1 MAG TPA: hypothetical protein [Caudoviricetes sp.]DAX46276.1 MAG TPA: hypothetical protein [Caudoviricetes sp.]
MVVIKKRDNVIPVDFGEFKLEFVANDKNIHKMESVGKKLKKDGEKLANTEDSKAFETLQDLVKGSWTELFDQDAYNKVYDFSNGSTVDTMAYLLEAITGVIEEWEKRNNTDALKKYLGD